MASSKASTTPVPMGVPVPTAVAQSAFVNPPQRPAGFSTGLCDCCQDCCSCWAVICCSPTVLGQLSFRVLWNKKGACMVVAGILWICTLLTWLINMHRNPESMHELESTLARVKHLGADSYDDSYDDAPTPPVADSFSADESGGWLVWVSALLSLSGPAILVLTCLIRGRIRARDAIPATCCGGWLDDCVLACCCSCCVLTQLMRHEGLAGERYKLTAEDGVQAMV